MFWYDIKNCKFSRIRSARYQLLDAPGSGRALELDQSTPPPPTLTEEHFRAYIDAFNHGEQNKYGDYYTDDVVLVITGKKELRGRQAIFDFYKGVKSETQRTIQVNKVLSSGNGLAVELQSEFLALGDVPDFIAGPMKKGGRIFVNTFVFYDLRDGKFARIRSAEFKKIPRPYIIGVEMDPKDLKVFSSRPLCGYGLYRRYNDKGDTKEAPSFTCVPSTP